MRMETTYYKDKPQKHSPSDKKTLKNGYMS